MEHPVKDTGAALLAFGSLFGYILEWLPLALSLTASVMSIVWLWMQMRDRAERRRRGEI